jgi:hypothetical protein
MPPGDYSTMHINAAYQSAANITSPPSRVLPEEEGEETMGFHDDQEDDFFDRVVSMADRLGIKGQSRTNYIDDHMLQAGYERVQARESYAKVRQADEDDQSSGNRWGFGARNRSSGRDDDDSF